MSSVSPTNPANGGNHMIEKLVQDMSCGQEHVMRLMAKVDILKVAQIQTCLHNTKQQHTGRLQITCEKFELHFALVQRAGCIAGRLQCLRTWTAKAMLPVVRHVVIVHVKNKSEALHITN